MDRISGGAFCVSMTPDQNYADKLLREFPQPVKGRPSLLISEQQSPTPVEYSVLVRNLPSCITQVRILD